MDYHRLDRDGLQVGCRALAQTDTQLATLYERNGVPPLWSRRPGFATLVQLILEQQVSLASGAAVYQRLRLAIDRMAPAEFLTLSDQRLLACGFSRQKTRYVRLLSTRLVNRDWRLVDLHRASKDDARRLLVAQVGIGPWTADVYLLMALRHPDVWPPGDIALIRQFEQIMPMRSIESRASVKRISSWAPWRSVAARLIWHDYLIQRGRA